MGGTDCLALSGTPGEYACGAVDLGDGVRAWLQPNGSWGETNAGLVSDGGTSLLVDTLWDADLAARMLDGFAGALRSAPLERVVTTHRDGDHWWGNVAVPATATILASTAAAAEMATEPPPAALARLRRVARLGAPLPGPPGRIGRYTGAMLGPFAFDGLAVRRPDVTFDGEVTLPVGSREVTAVEVGPAHTAGDVVVTVPHAGVVFCGDILFAGVTPVIWSGPVRHWIAALDRLLAMDADRFVPGHGPLATRADVRALRSYWTWLVDAGGTEHAAGRPPLEAARRMVYDPGFAPFRRWHNPERLVLNLVCLFRDLDGLPPLATSAVNRLKLFRMVADLAADLGGRTAGRRR